MFASGITATTSLIAPFDVARFALAYALLVLVPGYALAVLARPQSSWGERLAFSIPGAYALVALSGVATALPRLPYTLFSYGVVAVPVTVAGAYVWWRGRRSRTDGQGQEQRRWRLAVVGVVVVQALVIALVFGGYVVPPGGDAVVHVYWTDLVARMHAFPIALLSSSSGASSVNDGFYPPVFHVLTALVLGIAPMPAVHAVFYSMVGTLLALPVALFTYVRVATGSARVGALAALASLAFDPFPFYIPTQGMYTLTVSQLFVPALAIALCDALCRGDRRAVALSVLLGVGLFYTHPTEFVTVALLGLAIVPGQLDGVRAWARACGYCLVIAATWGFAALPALSAVRRTMVVGARTEIASSGYFVPAAHPHLSAALTGYLSDVFGRNVSYVLPGLAVIGAVWCLANRRLIGLVVAQALLTVVFLDATSYDLLRHVYVLSFPWALWERLAATHYWFTLPLAALGVDAVIRGIKRLARAASPRLTILAAAPMVVVGLALPLTVTVARLGAFTRAHVVMAPADLGAVGWLSRHAAPASVVVNDSNLTPRVIYDAPTDAGLWMPDMGAPRPLFWRGEDGPGSLADRNYLVRHIADNPLPARARRFIARHRVQYVFYGAGLRITARRHLNLGRLLSDRQLRLVYASEPCTATRGRRPAACPATGSYVFALRPRLG